MINKNVKIGQERREYQRVGFVHLTALFIVFRSTQIMKEEETCQIVYYLSNSSLFQPQDTLLLCHYKQFIEAIIMQLGEDWRIEASLFTEEILALQQQQAPAPASQSQFSLFNEFLSNFIQGQAQQQYKTSAHRVQNQTQDKFLQIANESFSHPDIVQSLTFKTLSLGFCITASEIWDKTFRVGMEKQKEMTKLKPFAKIVVARLGDNEVLARSEWQHFSLEELGELECQKIQKSIELAPSDPSKVVVLADLVCQISEIKLSSHTSVRIFSLCNQFYISSFVVWLIFNIKMFFALPSCDYLKYCKKYMLKWWKESLEKPLELFQKILDKQWNNLLKDYTVALHDDFQVLKMLIERVRKELEHWWESKLGVLVPGNAQE